MRAKKCILNASGHVPPSQKQVIALCDVMSAISSRRSVS